MCCLHSSLMHMDGPLRYSHPKARAKRKPLLWVSYPRVFPAALTTKELEGAPLPPSYPLALASGPEGYSLGGWERLAPIGHLLQEPGLPSRAQRPRGL